MIKKLNYLRRIFKAYLSREDSQLTFWHGTPQINDNFVPGELGQYYMLFNQKANYTGQFDQNGVPLLNYHGRIGVQYNPIAISQYGLGNYNLYSTSGDQKYLDKFLLSANWLMDHLEQNKDGLFVWNHYFDFEYRDTLVAPWYSGLAQGQGLSVLVRAYHQTRDKKYQETADLVFQSFTSQVGDGGVVFIDKAGYTWIEEYIVDPPTHILNGFIWALWGIYDYYLSTQSDQAKNIYERSLDTLRKNLPLYDNGFWSIYEQSGTKLKMIASPFYHSLHIVQLEILYQLTGIDEFLHYSRLWKQYNEKNINRLRALIHKLFFKIIYY